MNANEIIKKVTGHDKLYDMKSYIDNWLEWYTGDVKSFHNYTIYNGKKHKNCKRNIKPTHIPYKICKW